MSKKKQPTKSYLATAKSLKRFVPKLAPLAKQRELLPWQKGMITRYANLLKNIDHLIPLTKKQAKDLKPYLYQPITAIKQGPNKGKLRTHHGIQAVQMRNTGKDVAIKKVTKNILLTSNGREWVYLGIKDTKPRTMRKAGEAVFTDPSSYAIDRVIELARKAFENPKTKGVYLWSDKGRVGEPMKSLQQFTRWVVDDYSQYHDTEQWVKGLAILVADAGERISNKEWTNFNKIKHD